MIEKPWNVRMFMKYTKQENIESLENEVWDVYTWGTQLCTCV